MGFQIELYCRYFGPFLTWRLFGLLFEKLGEFFSNLLVTMILTKVILILMLITPKKFITLTTARLIL